MTTALLESVKAEWLSIQLTDFPNSKISPPGAARGAILILPWKYGLES